MSFPTNCGSFARDEVRVFEHIELSVIRLLALDADGQRAGRDDL
jgi:hypothetical protein